MPPIRAPKVVVAQVPQPVAASPPVTSVVDTVSTGAVQSPGPTAQPGEGVGLGTGTGKGQGRGNGADSGAAGGGAVGHGRPPVPRDMAFPFDNPPKELRGVSLSVTFWVRMDGRVERYEVVPEIKDREYAKKFDEVMRAFRFTPARAPDGTNVAGTTKISFTLPGKSSS
jgi:hypothetical protein